MQQFNGSLRLPDEVGPGLHVLIDLTDEHHIQITAASELIGEWPLEAVGIRASDDGFHLMAEGDEVVFRTDNDPAFALAVGLRHAPTLLRRQMSELLRYDPDLHQAVLEDRLP